MRMRDLVSMVREMDHLDHLDNLVEVVRIVKALQEGANQEVNLLKGDFVKYKRRMKMMKKRNLWKRSCQLLTLI